MADIHGVHYTFSLRATAARRAPVFELTTMHLVVLDNCPPAGYIGCSSCLLPSMSQPYHLDNYTPDESIGYLLKRAGGQLSTTLDRALAEFDMTHAQLGIFLRLLHGHADTAADLAREMAIDTGAMTRALDRLEEKGFIRRLRSHADRRMVRVSLTDKGKSLADQMTLVAINALNHHLRDFSPEEVTQFKTFLRRMIGNA
jgi:DNA-binding MarR family transcriptional regulator